MEQTNIIVHYLQDIPNLIFNPLGMLALCAMLIFLAYCLYGKHGLWLSIFMLLLCGIQGRYTTIYDPVGIDLVAPLEVFRKASKVIFVAILGCLALTSLMGQRGHTGRRLAGSIIALLLLQQLLWTKTLFEGSPVRAVGSMVLSLLLILGVATVLTRSLKDIQDIRKLFRTMEWAGLIFCVLTLIQIAFNPAAVMQGGRLMGLSGNPQFAAIYLSVLLNIVTYLLTISTETKRWRILHIICWGLFVIMLMWTGSRTGMLVALVGVIFQIRNRPSVWVFGALFITAGVYYLSQYSSETANALSRLTSTVDTRSGQFLNAWNNFTEHLIFGYSAISIENSYLSIASTMGLLGLTILAGIIILHVSNVVRIWKNRHVLGSEHRIADLMVALTLAMGAGAFFEGFVLAIATAAIVQILILLAVASVIRQDIDYHLTTSTPEENQSLPDEPQVGLA